MVSAAFTIIEAVASKVAMGLFANSLKVAASDFLTKRRIDTAQRRIADQLINALSPFFGSELSESESVMMTTALRECVEGFPLDADLLARSRYDIDSLIDSVIRSARQGPLFTDPGMEQLFRRLLRPSIVALMQIAPTLPNWELANWSESFSEMIRIGKAIEQNRLLLEELRNAPGDRSAIFAERYLEKVRRECSKIPVLGIGGADDIRQLSLLDCFVPIRLRQRLNDGEKPARESVKRLLNDETSNIDDALQKCGRVLLLGGPGAGKSTLLKYAAMNAASPPGNKHRIPFLLRIRDIRDFDSLPTPNNLMQYCAQSLDTAGAAEFVSGILLTGRALIVVDGLDECQLPGANSVAEFKEINRNSEWGRLMKWLEDLVQDYKDNQFLVSTRHSGHSRAHFGNLQFETFELAPLSDSEQRQFITNWYKAVELADSSAEGSVSFELPERNAADLFNRLSLAPGVATLVDTPLMLSVLCTVHRSSGASLPERRAELLSECVDVLLYKWRQAQGLRRSVIGDLGASELRGLLQPLAWTMLESGKAQADRSLVESVFEGQMPAINQPASRVAEIIETIRDRTGVLLEMQPGVFAFSHLIIRDYLAAEESREMGVGCLLEHASDAAWSEVLPLATGCRAVSPDQLVESLLERNDVTLAVRCAAASVRMSPDIRSRAVERASELAAIEGARDENVNRIKNAMTVVRELHIDEVGKIFRSLYILKRLADSSEVINSLPAWLDPEGKALTVSDYARAAVVRCRSGKNAEITTNFCNEQFFAVDFESPEEGAGLTWLSGSVTFLAGGVDQDRRYSLAVLWDSINEFGSRAWSRTGPAVVREVGADPERLALLVLLHQKLEAGDLAPFLDILDGIGVGVWPCTQIGLINALKAKEFEPNLNNEMTSRLNESWKRRSIAVRDHYLGVIDIWADTWGEEDALLSLEERRIKFAEKFNEYMEVESDSSD
jgi:hypothetical protein